ncbi:streptophobe family protein [Streptomyces fumanus]|uniref:streptophobe family protein n=1 Tax=Streptomyces fumanus TaxID=67302 RepID=UPI0033C97568
MSARTSPGRPGPHPHGWPRALGTVLAGLLAMGAVAALGLWAAGAGDLPGGAFPRVVTAVMVAAVGGSVDVSGAAGDLIGAEADLTVMPLSVTLTGALVIGRGFLRPLRQRTVAGLPELAGWAGRIAALWLCALLGLAFAARHTFEVSLGEGLLDDLGDLFGLSPTVGFAADVPLTVLFGLLWLAGVLLLAVLGTHGVPLPGRLSRFGTAVRPAASAVLLLLLACVAVGAVVALVVAATRGHPARTLAVLLLGLPNLVWPALTIGLGATWDGQVDGPFALPMPRLLDEVLRTPDASALNLGALAERDGRVWWLPVAAGVLLLAAGWLTAARSHPRTPVWHNAVRLAVALALAALMVCLVARVFAHGLSVLGIGDLSAGLSGHLFLRPRLWSTVGLAALWGGLAGLLGTPLARWTGRRTGR